jgi:hypothetical protein
MPGHFRGKKLWLVKHTGLNYQFLRRTANRHCDAPADIKPGVFMTIVVMTRGQVGGYSKVSAVGVLRDSRHLDCAA